MLAALEQVSQDTRRHSEATVRTLLEVVEGMMLRPVDPSAIPWNVFRLFERSGSETAWTKWLAAMLSPEQGQELSAVVWQSLCDAIIERGVEPCPVASPKRERLASLATWRELRDVPSICGWLDRRLRGSPHRHAPGAFSV